MKEKRNKRKNQKHVKSLLLFFFVIMLSLMCFFAYKIYQGIQVYEEGSDVYEQMQEIAHQEETGRIDFEALEKVNSDIVGWLYLEDTVIDYPVVKGNDNDYYLHHLYTGEYNELGTLFVDHRNRALFEDRISAIYGHSMKNGSMFYVLEKYRDQSFYDSHREFLFETKDRTYVLEPFAGKIVNAEIPFLQFNFGSDEEYLNYLKEFIDTSTFKTDIEVREDDRVVMMIKCSAAYTSARYVLLCRVKEV